MNTQHQTATAEAIPAGYKQTEVGVIPEDWEVFQILNHFNIFAGGDVPKDSLSNVRSESFPHPVYANALQKKGLYGFTKYKRAKGDSLTITARGYLGHAEYRSEPFFPIVRLLVLEPNGSLDAQYTTYAVNDRVKFSIESTGVPQLTAPQVGKYFIAAPKKLLEQTAIANALSDVDTLIQELEKLITKKRDIKAATMQQLLTGRTRLPQFAYQADGTKKGTKASELGEIPEDWEVRKIGKLVEKIVGGGTPSRSNSNYWGAEIPWVTVKDFSTFSPVTSQEWITHKGLSKSASNLIPKGTLITSTRMALGKAVIYKIDVAINQDLKALFTSNKLSTNFLYFWFQENSEKIDELGSGSTVKGLSLTDLKQIQIRLPKIKEQTAIATILSDIDTEIQTLEQRLSKTRQLKQGMMQELLTGRTRLVKPNPVN